MTTRVEMPVLSESTRTALAELSASSGIRSVHVLAWRDLVDPHAGGSEVHISTIAALWAQAGIDVTIRTSKTRHMPSTESRDGYRVVRKASRYGIFPRAAAAELCGLHGEADALIEIWNGMPFMSPVWWRKKPHNVWLHHVHSTMWTMMLGTIGHLGILLEEKIAPKLYRKVQVVTLSASSHAELVDLGFSTDRVAVVPPGISGEFVSGGEKDSVPTIIAVGRLAPVKRFHMMIDTVAAVRESVPDARLIIVGDGSLRDELEQRVAELGAQQWVRFAGRVSDAELVSLYQQAWVLSSASEREGWGMTITEAAACGTPAVVTRISGHSDAVVDGDSGLLANDESELAEMLANVLSDKELRARLRSGALDHAREYSWERTALETFRLLVDSAGVVSSS